MRNEPKVSVLMPCYNAEAYLKEAIDSIILQTYRNLEILLLDDGSTDSTKEMILEYASRDLRIVPIFNESNMGLIRTLNKGVKLATGEFIARMDADDISSLDRIEKIISAFQLNTEIDVISASFYYISPEGKVLRRNFPKATITKALHFVSFFCTPVLHPCVVVKAKLFSENLFDEQYLHSEDYEIFSRLLAMGYKFMNLNEPLYYLRMNRQSVSYKFEKIQISTHTKISARNIEDYFGIKYDFFLHKVMINRISFSVSGKLLKLAIRSLRDLKNKFIVVENPSPEEISQINDFLTEQYIDIYLQSLKAGNWFMKPFLLVYMLFDCKFFLNKRGLQYIRSKMWFLPVQN
ncbi:MAG: glycosyltransferase family 2 protein [Bacteroidetes bacterium]|nr:glycosyltransferase family 2 protein [Bacteroidota bacterium]